MTNILKYQNPNSPLFNPHKIIENVPAREWGPRKINEDYSITEGKGTNFWRAPFQYWGNKGLGSQNEKLARDLVSDFTWMMIKNPNYNPILDKNYQSYDDAVNYLNHLEGLKKYLGLPYDTGLLMESKYKPTWLQGTNEKTYKFKSSTVPGYWDDVVEDMVIGEHNKNQYYDQSLNEFTAYRDRDEKGDFVSIYDEWDYNPAVRGGNKKLNKVVDSVTGGKPFVIYDRIYLDDYYDIPEEARGNPFITPAVVTAYKKGGSIHIKKKNRGKFTESAKRAGMGVQEYAKHILANKDKYSPTLVKRANFARNAKKFKHEDGGILKYQNPSETLPELIQRINKKSKANFVKRLLDPNRKSIQDWVAPLNIATHKLGWATEDTKQEAFVYPEVQEINGELIDFTHPSHRRSEGINSAIERRDTVRMTPEQAKWFTENYKQYYPRFKDGGILKAQDGTEGLVTPHPLSPVGIALNQAKAIAKMKGDQQHLPPGVKEVVGPDGKKVAIRIEQPLVPLEQSIAEWMPGTGDVAEIGYIANDIKNGNYGTAAMAAGLTFLPGNWRKLLDKIMPAKKDKFVDFFQNEIGKTVTRVPVTKSDFGGVYSDGFRYLDESGKEIAHIAGSKYGDRVFVESSFMDPEFRSKGIGKQMYFDFNDQMFDKYGKTIGSSSGQHMMTMELPGSNIRISPSGNLWRGLRKNGLATTERPPIVDYIMVEPKTIKPYKKYTIGGKI